MVIGGTGGAAAPIDGYVADSLYPSCYHGEFAPDWTDAVLLRCGQRPPRAEHDGSFTLLDLGCGDGLGLLALAYANPGSNFIGIDANAGHIERGRRIATSLGITNAELRCATFEDALADEAIGADYVAAQGVLSWIGPRSRVALLGLIAKNLRPGGALTIGYNAYPGWTHQQPLQKLLNRLSKEHAGTPMQRFEAALGQARALSRKGMVTPGEAQFAKIDRLLEAEPSDYFAHEYLNDGCQPMWSCDVIEMMAEAGLQFVHTAQMHKLRRDFVLRPSQCDALDAITDPASREMAADLYGDAAFRVDVFQSGAGHPIPKSEAMTRRMKQTLIGHRSASEARFELRVPAGTLRFENSAASQIMQHLDDGPADLAQIAAAGGEATDGDLLNTLDALIMAGHVGILGAEPGALDPDRIERWQSDAAARPLGIVMTPAGLVTMETEQIDAVLADDLARARLGLPRTSALASSVQT